MRQLHISSPVLEEVREFGVTREEALEEILLLREKTEEKVERNIALLKEEKKRWIDKCRDLHVSSAGA